MGPHFISDFQPPELWGINVCCLEDPPGSGVLLQQPEWTETVVSGAKGIKNKKWAKVLALKSQGVLRYGNFSRQQRQARWTLGLFRAPEQWAGFPTASPRQNQIPHARLSRAGLGPAPAGYNARASPCRGQRADARAKCAGCQPEITNPPKARVFLENQKVKLGDA